MCLFQKGGQSFNTTAPFSGKQFANEIVLKRGDDKKFETWILSSTNIRYEFYYLSMNKKFCGLV